MLRATREHQPDLILHLGDHDFDTAVLTDAYPYTPIRAVRGNCDFGSKYALLVNFEVAGKRIVMTHGHRYDVKTDLIPLIRMGQKAQADLLLFGHTHCTHYEQVDTMHVLNPGSAMKSCALVEIVDGEIFCRHIVL